jgi:hypothetical protein
VLPLKNSGWLEERTIEVLRFRSIRRLRAADRFSRLRVCYPVVPGLDGDAVQVHSKILVVDDRLFRVGSSNLTSRSMRLDTECDLTVEATTAAEHRGIAKLRNRLLAEHLGLPVEDVERFLVANPSLVQLVDWRRMQSRCLRELDSDADAGEALVDEKLIDPSEPITTKVVVESLPGSAPLLRQWLLPAALACAAITLGLWAFGRAMRTTLLPETR